MGAGAVFRFRAGTGSGAWEVITADGRPLVATSASASVTHITRVAGERGIGPEVVMAGDRWLAADRLTGQRLTPVELRRPGVLREVAELLARWHRTPPAAFGPDLPAADLPRADLLGSLRDYVDVAGRRSAGLLDAVGPGLRTAVAWAEQALPEGAAADLVMCHLDTMANLVDTSDGLRLIDFDFAALATPAQELGQLMWEGELDERSATLLVDAYDSLTGHHVADAATWCVVSGVTWTLWAATAGQPSMDRYARRCWERLATHWARPDDLAWG